MSGPLITDLPLWERHEQRVLTILRSALQRLQAKGPLAGDERALNRELYGCILDVNAENQKSGGPWFDHPPSPEGENPPTPDTEGTASERKIPDLQWGFIDHQSPDPRRGVRNFVIECKRLGSPSNSGQVFNELYATAGVRRFADPQYRYGKDVNSGAMVGYVQSLTPSAIIVQVNGALQRDRLPQLGLPTQTGGTLTEIDHVIHRSFEISPFRLFHLWIR